MRRLPTGLSTAALCTLAALCAAAPTPPDDEPEVAGPPVPSSTIHGSEPAGEALPKEPLAADMGEVIVELVGRLLEVPRFDDEVEVRDRYQEALDAHLQAADLECQVTASSGPPTQDELNRYSANPRPQSADLLTPGKLLFGKAKGLLSGDEPRFFLYSVRRENEPARVVYLVADAEIAASTRESVPETAWELVARYSDRDQAAKALERLERGDPADPDDDTGWRRALWAATRCED